MAEQERELRDAELPTVLSARHAPTRRRRTDLYLLALALLPVFWMVAQFFGLVALVIAVAAFVVVVVAHVVLDRRNLDGEKIVGGIIGVLGGLGGAVALLNTQFPSSVSWMSAIVCHSPYHLTSDVSHYSYRPGESSSSVDYACVSGDNVYDVNDFTVWGLQALGIAVVLCPVAVLGYLIWRRMRRN